MIIALQTLIYFRESLLTILDRLIGPYYKRFSLSLIKKSSSSDDEDSDEQVFSEFDDEKGVIFFPPMYVQRYAAVNDCLLDERWNGKLEKIVDLGYHDMTFIKYLKEVPGVKHILGVDIENVSLRCSPDIICDGEYAPRRETPLQITLFEGNAADPDYRLIGCDAVVAIEMIEHMLPHDLDRLVHNIFGFIQPQVAVITTPNADFNVLFKSMENNGLRRWDHLFEWSREQFNDWCSNIVLRYPNYTVTCKGVGPGPPGTEHYGCCSQLALFVSKNYQKQPSLTIDSMALVKSLPNDNNLSDVESWDYTDSIHESNMLCAPPNDESFTELPFPEKRSCMTIVILGSPPIDTLVYKDNTSQCNIDREIGRSYLMFDEDVSENIVVPRRKVINRVYEIEDVSSRLHCSMLQVRKFSKTTQNLMAKNKLDSVMHTREIVDEIRQLTKTLNLNRNTLDQQQPRACRLQVKDLLEWNGYEVVDNIVIHSRLIVENVSMTTPDNEYQDNDALSDVKKQFEFVDVDDWDMTEMHSTSYSNASSNSSHPNGKWLQRSLDFKVRKLRNLLTADEDISTELDRVVCRLMKLAITTHKNKSVPPPTSWLQCKLLDLLTLTERAIQRRKRYYFNQNPSFTFGDYQTTRTREIEPPKSNDNESTNEIMSKYTHFVETTDEKEYKNTTVGAYQYVHLQVEDDDMSVTSNELVKAYDYNKQECSASPSYGKLKTNKLNSNARDPSPARTYPITDNYSGVSSSGDTDHSIKLSNDSRSKKSSRKSRRETNKDKHKIKLFIKKSKKGNGKETKYNEKYAGNAEKKIYFKRTIKKKSFCRCSIKNSVSSAECESNKVRNKRRCRRNHQISSMSKPIPYSLVKLCTPKDNDKTKKLAEDVTPVKSNNSEHLLRRNQESIAITEQSCVIEIVTNKTSETLALHRTITTDLSNSIYKNNLLPLEFKDRLDIVPVITKSESSIPEITLKSEKEESQAIFLYDINEPSTSKGIRHITMDVQCGPDTGFVCPYTSATSLNNITNDNTNTTYLKSYIDKCEQSHYYTKPEDNNDVKSDNVISSRVKSNGIQIKDSDNSIDKKLEISTKTVTKSIDAIETFKDSPDNICNDSTDIVTSLRRVCDEVSNIIKSDKPYPQSPQNVISKLYGNEDEDDQCKCTYLKPIIDLPQVINSTETEQFLRKDIDFTNSICNIGNGNLTYGGIFIHSYKERTECEDILYQGKWQRSLSKTFMKKNPVTTFTLKKTTESHNIKRRNSKLSLTAKTVGKKNEHSRSSDKLRKISDLLETKKNINVSSNNKNLAKKKPLVELCKPTRRRKTLREVASKTVRFDLSKNTRFERVTVKSSKSKIYKNSKKDKKKVVTFKESHSKCELNTTNELLKALNYTEEKGNNDFPKNLTNTLNVKKELMKFVREPHKKIVYSVFRNKIENETDNQRHSKPSIENRKNKEHKSARNIQAANSSSSSTNSIVTIRQLSPPSQNRKKFTSKITLKVSNNPKASSMKEKHSVPVCYNKSSIIFDDKENNPQSSNVRNFQCNKENTHDVNEISKSILMSRNVISKQKNKSLIIKKSIENIEEKLAASDSTNSSKVSSVESIKNQSNFNANSSNSVLVLGSYKNLPTMDSEKLSPNNILCTSENNQEIVHTSIIQLSCKNNEMNISNSISDETVYNEMMTVVDEMLNFIDDPERKSILTVESKKMIPDERKKSGEKVHFYNAPDNESIATSLDSGPKQVNLDLISFKSFASLSGYSEYFLADSELSTTIDSLQVKTPSKRSSVQDIFERNDQTRLPFPGDSVQGFSGFSINEQVIGDQPDYANLINPETGIMETRRATSEEVFTSGRSSDTYESCQVDEDALVPNWLFHAISQQQSDEDREPQRILSPIPMPTVEPDLDLHTNVMEPGVGGVGGAAGAGAGDGRGIHSDQDSSGRDTSMSSTETSSGQQSDAILVDPSAYANNIEFLREPSSRPFLQLGSTESPDSSFRTVEGSENDNLFNMSEISTRNNLNLGAVQSDRDADVSSLDTDTADFSDN
ncbi:Small RNA 2'-O-methyltransferase [Papilio machaon]|uniref:Small RNA 2'-O-methyltransferase n=1 Tax=Papilio machaon TaxID=76193 RepID=A0A194QM98_PAPMA|nr:Small RNA 2'-O-methyltransferase [Papilio machaon]